ncbi:MAG: NADH-quinone oxidoreductase subunit H [Candidatus Omnitrophica bacterium]|jgi:NADH-quinone oxidoreductase subunit H|nr:NADH-quinone oxidoreductase subunit H [Candidatus Omnitrophota bacterium]
MFYQLFSLLIFPGLLFVSVSSLFAEFLDRRIYARLQNRIGPPWFQPFADFIKLLAKEEIIPRDANPRMFKMMPIFAFASAVCAFLYIPLYKTHSLFYFDADLIVVLYFLTIPTLAFFIGGWYSTSLYARIGSVRSLTQLFAYEVPLFIGILSAAVLANTWSISELSIFYGRHPFYWLFNLIGFGVSLIALLAKLEKGPFDIPEAETEIVAGSFTEYSGRHLAFLRLTLNVEMVVGSALLAAVFLPFGYEFGPVIGFLIFLCKIIFIIALLSLSRTVFARMRIDQMINFCWKYLVPFAFFQLLLNLILKGVILR